MEYGGGLTFIRNFKKGMAELGCHVVPRLPDADIVLIAGATLTNRDEILEARRQKKKIVFRVDNIPKDSANRGTAIPRMRDFAEMSDVIIYQSEWAKEYASIICGDGTVIYNGVDTDVFKPDGKRLAKRGREAWLYVRSSRNENKRFPEAAYHYHMAWRKNRLLEFWIVGKFGPESLAYNFDFFCDEPVEFMGEVNEPEQMAMIMRSADKLLIPYFADASPNTILEARACGLAVDLVNDVGGTKELLNPDLDISLRRMCQEYKGVFQILLEEKDVEIET